MERREPRKRISITRQMLSAIPDPMEFTKNKSSDHARSVTTINERITIDLWFDKHYVDRHQHGDINGKREGIDIEIVKNLVLNSVKHLLFYSSCIKNFTFLNHNGNLVVGGRAIRIICQQDSGGDMLNAVIEVHYKSLSEYEITVITAMSNNNFKLSDGQYAIEIIDLDSSVLKLMIKGRVTEVCSI